MNRKWRLAMFDWDCTLYNSLTLAYGSVVEIFRTYGLKAPSPETYRNEITADFMKFYWTYGVPKTATGDELNKIRKRYFEEHKNDARPNEWTERALSECLALNIPVVIVSAGIQTNVEQQIKEHRLATFVNHVRGNAWDKEKALLEMLERFGVKAGNAFYVDDTYDGLSAAKNVGVFAIGHAGKGAYNSKKRIMAAANHTIDSLHDLLPIIRGEAQS